MAFNASIERVKLHFGITKLADWADVLPSWILDLDGIGPATLDHIRIYLALRDVTLRNDKTPEYWKDNLSQIRIGNVMAENELHVASNFTVLIDKMEQQPFGFDSITPDASETPSDLRKMVLGGDIEQKQIKFIVQRKYESLGAAMGDYSVDGFKGRVSVERKSMADAHGTILSYGDRQQRFETELENLSTMESAAVVVECSLGDLLTYAPSHGKKTHAENRKILHRRVISWQQDFRVPWLFCDSREFAEVTTFRILQRFVRKQKEVNSTGGSGSKSSAIRNRKKQLSPELNTAVCDL